MSPKPSQLALSVQIRDDASFDNFFVGPNREVVDSLLRACTGKASDGAIFLAGPEGVGKTHLLQAACHLAGRDQIASVYLPLGELISEGAEVLDGLEELPLICIDDVQLIAGRDDWELAMFHLFNRVFERGSQLVFTADKNVSSLGISLADLASRLAWGFVFRLLPLSDEEKLKALQERAQRRGFSIPDEVGRFLLRRFPRDMSALNQMLHELDLASLAAQKNRLTIPFVKSWLENRDHQQPSLF